MESDKHIEKCWFADKHEKLGEEPLECLKCKRMKGKTILDRPDDPRLNLFMDGFRLAMMQIGAYLGQKKHLLPQWHKDMMEGLDIRFKCAIDRGITIEQLEQAVSKLSLSVLRDVLSGE